MQRKPRTAASDRLLVRFRDNVDAALAESIHRSAGAWTRTRFRAVDNLYLVQLPPQLSVKEAQRLYQRSKQVLYAEPDYLIRVEGSPNDPMFGSLWGLHNAGQNDGTPDADIDAPEAWDITTGSSSLVIGVIDTGVQYTHPDLSANLLRNEVECTPNGADDDGNGWVDDCFGVDTFDDDGDPLDGHGHGTHVAGTIGARGNNSLGVVGVNWQIKMVTCKFLGDEGWGYTSDAVECLDYFAWLKDHGVNLVATSNSWGGGGYSQALADAIERQHERGVLFVAAAGNNGSDNDSSPQYPANYEAPNVIAVAATDRNDALAGFSSYGRATVDLGAPGVAVTSTWLSGGYNTISGTSMATPHVTGVVGLMKAQDPSRDWRALKNLLLAGADAVPATVETTLSGRRLNARGALTCTDRVLTRRMRPSLRALSASPFRTLTLAVLNIRCGQPEGPVTVTAAPGGDILLRDDGIAPDLAAGDGVYSATFEVGAEGSSYTLTFPGNDVVSVSVPMGYGHSQTAYSYRSITGTGLNLGDDEVASIIPPFPVLVAGLPRSSLYVSSNGVISFGQGISQWDNQPLPVSFEDVIVAPFWDDLYPFQFPDGPHSTNNVFWAARGAAPNRELVIEWRAVAHYDCPNDSDTVTFQVVFSESSSDIVFNYADPVFGGACGYADRGNSATVGIQVGPESASQFSYAAPVVNPQLALRWQVVDNSDRPNLISLQPSSVLAGSNGFTLTVNGVNFHSGAQVLWAGQSRPTTFVSDRQLTAEISAADVAAANTFAVIVTNPGSQPSNALYFTVEPQPHIRLVDPNGGDYWYVGGDYVISWVYTGGVGSYVRIELWKDGALDRVIAQGVYGDLGEGAYNWHLPPDLTPGGYRIRLIGTEGHSDESDSDFYIFNPQLTLVSPNGGESWDAGSTHTIEWNHSGLLFPTTLSIGLRRNDSWVTHIAYVSVQPEGAGAYNWNIPPDLGGDGYRIQISVDERFDGSDADFRINPTALTVTSPNGGESWMTGTTRIITWSYTGDPGATVTVNLLKGGAHHMQLANVPIGAAGTGSFTWSIPAGQQPGSDYRIQVVSAGGVFVDASDADFTITAPAALTLAFPNGGNVFAAGSRQTIRWSFVGLTGSVKLELLKGGNLVQTISASAPVGSGGAGSFSWTIPFTTALGADYRVRITSLAQPSVTDISDADFRINRTGIAVTAPNGGETWQAGSAYTIRWLSYGAVGTYVRVELLKAGVVNRTIAISTLAASGQYSWTVPASQTLGSDYRIRVRSANYASYTDTSDANFAIANTSLTLTSPNGGEVWRPGTTQNITWTSTGDVGASVRLELLKAGALHSTIAASLATSAGSFAWNIPTTQPLGADYRVRVTSTTTSYTDTSNADFAIDSRFVLSVNKSGTGSGTVTSNPAGINCGATCSAAFSTGASVTLTATPTSGHTFAGWSGACSGTGTCTVAMNSDQAVTATFTAPPTPPTGITVTVPNGGESWRRGTTQTIRWTSSGAVGTAVRIYLYKNGALNRIIGYASTASGQFNWLVPSTVVPGADYRIRVTSSTNASYTDQSDANFSIQ